MSDLRFEIVQDTARFTISGRLDATNAPALTDQLKSLIGKGVQKVYFNVKALEYISSAGLRAMIFAKQKVGAGTQVYVVDPQKSVVDIIKMTGFDSFLTLQQTGQP